MEVSLLVAVIFATVLTQTAAITPVTLSSNIEEATACLGEQVVYTCTVNLSYAVLHWRNEVFNEITLVCNSAPAGGGGFRAVVVSCDEDSNSITSTLTVSASTMHNGTVISCTNLERTMEPSTVLLIAAPDIFIQNLIINVLNLTTVLLQWDVHPHTDAHCIIDYIIRITGSDETEWEMMPSGNTQSFLLSGVKHAVQYTVYVTANSLPTVTLENTFIINATEPNPPLGLDVRVSYEQRYDVHIYWQQPQFNPFSLPLTGYNITYQSERGIVSILVDPSSLSHTIEDATGGSMYTITVSARNEIGESENNPLVTFAIPLVKVTSTPQDSHTPCDSTTCNCTEHQTTVMNTTTTSGVVSIDMMVIGITATATFVLTATITALVCLVASQCYISRVQKYRKVAAGSSRLVGGRNRIEMGANTAYEHHSLR